MEIPQCWAWTRGKSRCRLKSATVTIRTTSQTKSAEKSQKKPSPTYCVDIFDLQMRLQVDKDVSLIDGAQVAFALIADIQNGSRPLLLNDCWGRANEHTFQRDEQQSESWDRHLVVDMIQACNLAIFLFELEWLVGWLTTVSIDRRTDRWTAISRLSSSFFHFLFALKLSGWF